MQIAFFLFNTVPYPIMSAWEAHPFAQLEAEALKRVGIFRLLGRAVSLTYGRCINVRDCLNTDKLAYLRVRGPQGTDPPGGCRVSTAPSQCLSVFFFSWYQRGRNMGRNKTAQLEQKPRGS